MVNRLFVDIHPLSIEDILHGRQTSRSKADCTFFFPLWLVC